MNEIKNPIIKRNVKHVFSAEEKETLVKELTGALQNKSTQESEFDSVKSSYKAKITESESTIERVAADLRAGFTMRLKDCEVLFRMPEKKKDIVCCETREVVAHEDMTTDDLQMELLAAEQKFEGREVLSLFEAGCDKGEIVLGQLNKRWFSAARLKVGQHQLDQRLDSEQKSYKGRADALRVAIIAAKEWLKGNFKDAAKGFEDKITAVFEAQKERSE